MSNKTMIFIGIGVALTLLCSSSLSAYYLLPKKKEEEEELIRGRNIDPSSVLPSARYVRTGPSLSEKMNAMAAADEKFIFNIYSDCNYLNVIKTDGPDPKSNKIETKEFFLGGDDTTVGEKVYVGSMTTENIVITRGTCIDALTNEKKEFKIEPTSRLTFCSISNPKGVYGLTFSWSPYISV